MAAVSQTRLSNSFSWMKIVEFRLKFHWNLFHRVQLTVFHHYYKKCVSEIKHILSLIHHKKFRAVCFQFTHFLCDDWENICIFCLIIIIKPEVWTITHCLGLCHETIVCAVCLSIFLLVQIMAWCRPGDKPLCETMMVSSPTHICVTRPQWVKV